MNESRTPAYGRLRKPVHEVARLLGHVKQWWFGRSWETRLVFLGMVAFTGIVTFLSDLRHATFQTNAWDQGIYMQSLWTTAFDGKLLYYTAELSWNASGSLFGVHSMPILLLVVPIYRLFPSAITLFAIQSAVVAGSAAPLYLLMRRRTSRRVACVLALAYLASPPLLGGVFFDFHVEAFLPLMALTTWWAWETRRYRAALLAAVGLLAVIEFAAVILGAIAFRFLILGLVRYRRARRASRAFPLREDVFLPFAVMVASAVLMFLLFAIPKIVSPLTPPFIQVGPLGNSLQQILLNLLNPSLVVQALAVNASAKAVYLGAMVLAGGAIWVLRPWDALPALPWTLVALLTAAPLYASPAANQYAFMVIPFLFPATASAIPFLQGRLHRMSVRRDRKPARRRLSLRQITKLIPSVRGNEVVAFVGVALVASQLAISPLSPLTTSWLGVGRLPGAHEAAVEHLLGLIPSGASVSAQPNLFPHVADRTRAYPYFVLGVDYVIADVSNGWFNGPLPPPTPNASMMRQLRENATGEYGLLASVDGVFLLLLGYAAPLEVFQPLLSSVSPAGLATHNASFFPDATSPMGSYLLTWSNRTDATLWSAPELLLPLGEFEVRLWIREGNASSGTVRVNATLDSDLELAAWDFPASALSRTWTVMSWRVTLPHPGLLRIASRNFANPVAIEVGGLLLAQLPTPAVLR